MAAYTKKVARQHTRRRLATIRKSLSECSRNWEDFDQSVVNEIETVIEATNDIEKEMDESIELDE
jgi:cobalamin biosynthesis protein CobD/CbiB